MKVLHVCLSNFYIDNAGYQENHLVRQHVSAGHEVRVIASVEVFDRNGSLVCREAGKYFGSDGALVIRLPYLRFLPEFIGRKLRYHFGVYRMLEEFSPDVIMFHGCSSPEILTVAKYVKRYSHVVFYADAHSDANNSGRSLISGRLLHGLFYKYYLRRALPWIRKILCVSFEVMDFVKKVYGVPDRYLEFFPLGGVVLDLDEVFVRRDAARVRSSIGPDAFVFIQTGKMAERKKLARSLRAFSRIDRDSAIFLIVGVIPDSTNSNLHALINSDSRVRFLGWKDTEELTDLLCAADVYVQPGSQSATMQHALCCGCPVIIDDVPAHKPYESSGAVLVSGEDDLVEAMIELMGRELSANKALALKFSKEMLDYRALSERVLR